jgi:uncharacterized GH25 family protein
MQRIYALPALLVLSALLPIGTAQAHDFWIDPSTYAPAIGETVQLEHRVGDAFRGDPLARNPDLLVEFSAADAAGSRSVPGVAGVRPAGAITARVPGALLVGYESWGSEAVMDAETMVLYVEEEGIANQLPPGWQKDEEVRDVFSRSAKTLLTVTPPPAEGEGVSEGFDRELGLPLELIPLNDPRSLRDGGKLGLRLLFDGEPVAAVRVAAVAAPAGDAGGDAEGPEGAEKSLSALTDDSGRVTLTLPHGGRWLIKAVHIRPTGEASYRSHWASLTFQTR